jgi:DNA-binding LytR/AlgR family response regulator
MKALLVDDEPLARRVLSEELESMNDIDICGEAEDGEEALRKIALLQPDIVFMDIQMPGMNGLEVIQQFRGGEHLPVFILVTAFDEHAIRAFEAGAIDYLLKPVSQQRLALAIEKARRLQINPEANAEALRQIQEESPQKPGDAKRSKLRRIVGKAGKEYYLLNAEEVLGFQAEGELVWIYTLKQRFLATQTLRSIQERLSGLNFHRIHRNALVNLDHVRKMSSLSSQRWLVTLSNGQDFVVSKRQAGVVQRILNW